jgi:hypothetical protein
VYLSALAGITFFLTLIFSMGSYFIYGEWIWLWEMRSTPGLMVLILCVGISNYLIEDYIKCECGIDEHKDK